MVQVPEKNLMMGKVRYFFVLYWSFFLILFIAAFVRTAWVAEDAFITFRVLDNFVNGYGVTWNPGERVQAFTHPLWFLILIPFFYLNCDPYYTVIALSFLCFLLTVILLMRVAPGPSTATLAAMFLLLCSRSFVDYSSSGLENPLQHLLLAAYLTLHVTGSASRARLHWHVLFAGLLWLTRPDAIVPILPLLGWHFFQAWRDSRLCDWRWLAALLPVLAWFVFALFYFGSPIPNTALAKVATAIGVSTKIQMASEYFIWSLREDPASFILLGAGVLAGLCSRQSPLRLLAAGLLAWIAYLFVIGADYMLGRFLSAATLIAAFIVIASMQGLARWRAKGLCLLAIIVSPALARTVGAPASYYNPVISKSGIADERGFYYPWLGLLPALYYGDWQRHPWFAEGAAAASHPGLYVRCAVGMFAYRAGSQVKIIDPYALTDSFLARLPSKLKEVRPGHYEREIPLEYMQSLITGQNHITAPELGLLYEDVSLVRVGEIVNPQRLAAIVRLNIDDLRGRNPEMQSANLVGSMLGALCPRLVDGQHEGGTYTWSVVYKNEQLFIQAWQG